MRTLHWMVGLGLVATAMIACGGEEAAPTPDELAGTYTATSSKYASTTGLGTVDIIAAGGATTLVLRGDLTYSLTVTLSGGAPSTSSGTYKVNSFDELLITPGGGSNPYFPWAYSRTGAKLHLEAQTGNWLPWYGYDFDGDGTGDPANWTADLTK